MAEAEQQSASGLRSFWTGTITFGLVSVPVALYPANKSQGVSLRMVDPSGTPLRRRYVCSKDGEELDDEEIVRGYEVKKGKFVLIEDEELEAIEPRKSRDIDLQLFVPTEDLDPIYFERAYFLAPAGGSNKAYRLLARVMEEGERAGIATFVMRDKEYLVAILAENGILRAETLRFADEIRRPSSVGLPKQTKAKAATVKRFERAIGSHSRKANFRELIDPYAARLEKVVKKKRRKGEDIVKVSAGESREESGAEVIDLVEALSKSLGGKVRKPARRAASKSGRKRSSKKR